MGLPVPPTEFLRGPGRHRDVQVLQAGEIPENPGSVIRVLTDGITPKNQVLQVVAEKKEGNGVVVGDTVAVR